MRDYSVLLDGKRHKTHVETVDGKTFTVDLNGREYRVRFEPKVSYGKSLLVQLNDRSFTVKLGQVSPRTLAVTVENNTRNVSVHPIFARKEITPKPISDFPSREPLVKGGIEGAIDAPMPGRIIAIKVAVGDKVKPGDAVFILEAMKMENEIVTPREGTVREMRVTKGMSVAKGEVLAVVR
ncbi:MAG: biotin/lipoyl-containing protein [Candidatus Bathyarchaeia archaeon]